MLIVLVLLVALALPGAANANHQGVLVGAPAPAWQTNGTVWALAAANGAVYLGGDFTSVRPPGAAAGTGEVPRNHLAAFDAATGELLPFNPDLDAPVYALVASADGSRVYAGGEFLSVGGVAVRRLAAFDTASGALIGSWKVTASSGVRALEASGNTVYVGGDFGSLDSQPRARLGAVDATSGALRAWAPGADAEVLAISSSKDGEKVYVGGRFDVVNGSPQHAIAALSASTGALLPFPAATAIPPKTSACSSVVKDLTTDATTVYSANEGTGVGCFDGTFAANISDGSLKWKNSCLGATQAVEVIGSFLYKGSHAHDCSSVAGGFPETGSGPKYHLLAENLSDGLLGPWYPNTNATKVGPRVFATDGQRLFVGGDFTKVNGQPQQGFTRFEPGPDTTPPTQPAAPEVASVEPGAVRVTVTATWDRDDNDLTYRLLRDGSSTPIKTWTLSSKPWSMPTVVYDDSGLVPGSTHTYQVLASDGRNSIKSPASAPVVVRGTSGSPASTPVVVRGTSGSYAGRGKADFPCLAAQIHIGTRGLGPIGLGLTKRSLLRRPPPPRVRGRQVWRYCVSGGHGGVVVAFSRTGRVRLALSTAPGHSRGRIRRGASLRRLRRIYSVRRRGPGLYTGTGRGRRVVFGVRRGRVRFVGVGTTWVVRHSSRLRRYVRLVGL
jgi:hypothetical protein